jgi:3-oxoacyl-[acyl-carrier-protein] synthase II
METRTPRGHRVVLTGAGLVTPLGLDLPTTWSALKEGVSGAAPITQFDANENYDVRFACEVKGFQPEQYQDRKEVRRTDRFAQFAIAVAEQAVQSAGLADGLESLNRDRFGVVIGSGIGGMATFEDQTRTLIERGPRRISPFFVPMFIADIAAGLVSMRFGARGPNFATVSGWAPRVHDVGAGSHLL